MRIARNLLGLSRTDMVEIRSALLMLSEAYYQIYQEHSPKQKQASPGPYFHYSLERAERCRELSNRFFSGE